MGFWYEYRLKTSFHIHEIRKANLNKFRNCNKYLYSVIYCALCCFSLKQHTRQRLLLLLMVIHFCNGCTFYRFCCSFFSYSAYRDTMCLCVSRLQLHDKECLKKIIVYRERMSQLYYLK